DGDLVDLNARAEIDGGRSRPLAAIAAHGDLRRARQVHVVRGNGAHAGVIRAARSGGAGIALLALLALLAVFAVRAAATDDGAKYQAAEQTKDAPSLHRRSPPSCFFASRRCTAGHTPFGPPRAWMRW